VRLDDRRRVTAVGALALAAAAVALLDARLPGVRDVLACLLVLILPGWAVLAAAGAGAAPRGLDGLLLSLGLSLVISMLACAALALSGAGVGAGPVALTLAAVTVIACLHAHGRADRGNASCAVTRTARSACACSPAAPSWTIGRRSGSRRAARLS
jgi:uncharacterized membrane protein